MSLDGRIEQLVENGLVIQVSVDVNQLSDGSGIAQETQIPPSAQWNQATSWLLERTCSKTCTQGS